MGRFRLLAEQEDQWEFIGEDGQEGALVPRESVSEASTIEHETTATIPEESMAGTAPNNVFIYHNGDGSLAEPILRYHPSSWRTRTFVLTLLIAVVSWFFRDGPPGPPMIHSGTSPPELHSWQSFLDKHRSQLWESSTALVYHTPLHILRWWLACTAADVADLWQWMTHADEPGCSLTLPEDLDATRRALQEHLIGQSLAVNVVSDALEAWALEKTQQSPLLLYLTGYPGTGKATLARLLAGRVLFQGCPQPPVLWLNGADFSPDRAPDGLSLRRQLEHWIVRHVHQHAEGSMIVLENVEHMDPLIFTWLVDQLANEQALDGESPRQPLSRLREKCRQTIFVFTSPSIGNKAISRALRRQELAAAMNSPGFLLDVADEIDQSFAHGLSSKLDAIAPFVPLTKSDLMAIVRSKVRDYSLLDSGKLWHSFQVSDKAIENLLAPNVEYITWNQRNSETTAMTAVLTFSSTGAAMLGDKGRIWSKIRAQTQRCLAKSPDPTQMAYLDVPFGRHGELMWCNPSQTESQSDPNPSACRKVCHFKLS